MRMTLPTMSRARWSCKGSAGLLKNAPHRHAAAGAWLCSGTSPGHGLWLAGSSRYKYTVFVFLLASFFVLYFFGKLGQREGPPLAALRGRLVAHVAFSPARLCDKGYVFNVRYKILCNTIIV